MNKNCIKLLEIFINFYYPAKCVNKKICKIYFWNKKKETKKNLNCAPQILTLRLRVKCVYNISFSLYYCAPECPPQIDMIYAF